jgi:hypothetical protein
LAGKAASLGPLTVTVNYSADPAGTPGGRTQTSDFSNPFNLIPGGAESVGLTRILPDTIFWYDDATSSPKLGNVNPAAAHAFGGSVEPYAERLGDSTFLLAASSYASDNVSMRFTSILQPATGGAAKISDNFYDDSGKPYTNQINLSRQDGNPGRMAGDPRYGAVNFMGGGEASLYAFPTFFNSDNRFDATGPFYSTLAAVSGRDSCVQTYSLNPSTLAQTMLSKAQDSAFGRCCTNATYPASGNNQISRFGGHIQGLDNGNFVSVVEDRSNLNNPSGNASVATIFGPNGSIVKEAFLVANGDQWANVAAFRGGFAVRPSGTLIYFFDNAGNLQGSVDHNSTSGLSYEAGRGDGTRIYSDIRSHYVYMAGASGGKVWLSAFDAVTRTFVAKTEVDEYNTNIQRVNLAVDGFDRICVAYGQRPTVDFLTVQVVARVFAFNGTQFNALTPTFFPFLGHDAKGDTGILTKEVSVAMTPRQILISAEGTLNSTNNGAAGPDMIGTDNPVYTIISHPAPMAAPQPNMTITRSGANLTISWQQDAGLFTLQSRSSLSSGSWADVSPQPPITGPSGGVYTKTVSLGAGNLFFRLSR